VNVRQEPHPQGAAFGLDTSRCEQEPIHIPGAIQPHGALLAALLDGGLVTHASANLSAILGCPAETALGQPLEKVIGEAACRMLQNSGNFKGLSLFQRMQVVSGPDGRALYLRAFRSGRHLCVDIEPTGQDASPGQAICMLQSLLGTIKDANGTAELCELAVNGLRAVSGFDRVMAYRFDKDGHGEVIAEAVGPHLEPFLGLHYPAADIPPQARRLILAQPVGRIADTSYRPVPLLADGVLDDGVPLDLTESALRSVSPYHLEYLRNMNVAACLTIGLAHGRDLWGMLVCHHTTPRIVPPEVKAAAHMIGQIVSLLLGSLGQAEASAARFERMSILRALTDRLAAPVSLMDAFAAGETELLSLVGATGAVLCLSGKVIHLGLTPPPPEAEHALAVLRPEAHGEVLAIDNLSQRYPMLAGCVGQGSGALVLPLAGGADDAILWFRPELAQSITWGGNPAEHVTLNLATGDVSPRASFAAWKEIVTGHSAPWAEVDLTLACDLRSTVIAEAAKRTKAELFELRHYDPLTGLPNRALLQERLAEANGETGATVTLLFVRLEETREINETMGHAAGDELLIEVARRLVAAAGLENLAARLGGAEFVVLCCGLQPGAAAELGEVIRRSIAAPFKLYGRLFHLAPGIGIAVMDQSNMLSPASAADFAMQEAITMIGAKQRAESQRQKMETLGRTMGGVAHEINNMLQPITLLVQEVIDEELIVGEGKQHLDIVLDCSKKARQIIGDMLAFSRPAISTMEIHDPVALLHDSLPIVRRAIPPGLMLSIMIEGRPPLVRINRTTFVQILLNLAVNAVAAMNGQGELTITLEEDVRGLAESGMGQQISFVRLRVIDNGCGMDKATLDRAFEPFFTTKPVGQGTGLGLPVVYGLVREMGATIVLASEPGCGTTVTLLIPAKNGEPENGGDIGN
jgi:diguanylate cyclase (GGDEF)-like protein